MLKKLRLLLLAFLPSPVKVWVLNRSGHNIHKSCRIGVCYLDIDRIVLRKGAAISSGNLFKGLQLLEMHENARIGGFLNWFTASPLHRESNPADFGRIVIGAGSNITSRHFFDAQRTIEIGADTLIAGFNSTFWTHGYRGFASNKSQAIQIGDHCYIGSQCIFVPGARIAGNTIVGAGSVVSGDHTSASNVLLAGNPACAKKRFTGDEEFFTHSHGGFKANQAPTNQSPN